MSSILLVLTILAAWSWMVYAPMWFWLPLTAVFAIAWLRVNAATKDS